MIQLNKKEVRILLNFSGIVLVHDNDDDDECYIFNYLFWWSQWKEFTDIIFSVGLDLI